MQNYARASQYVCLHFESYDEFTLTPVIKDEIWNAEPKNKEYVTVYLPSYCDNELLKFLQPLKDFRFEVFSRQVNTRQQIGHITLIPVGKEAFTQSLVNCFGIITGGGFETPAEALYLKKKIIAIPIKGQYEQLCNAAALKKLGVKTLDKLDDDFTNTFNNWATDAHLPSVNYNLTTENIVHSLMCRTNNLEKQFEAMPSDLILN